MSLLIVLSMYTQSISICHARIVFSMYMYTQSMLVVDGRGAWIICFLSFDEGIRWKICSRKLHDWSQSRRARDTMVFKVPRGGIIHSRPVQPFS